MNTHIATKANLRALGTPRRFSRGLAVFPLIVISACVTTFVETTKVGSLSQDNIDYDVYSTTFINESQRFPKFVFVRKGVDPESFGGAGILFDCDVTAGVTQSQCENLFRLSLAKRKSGGLSGGTDN